MSHSLKKCHTIPPLRFRGRTTTKKLMCGIGTLLPYLYPRLHPCVPPHYPRPLLLHPSHPSSPHLRLRLLLLHQSHPSSPHLKLYHHPRICHSKHNMPQQTQAVPVLDTGGDLNIPNQQELHVYSRKQNSQGNKLLMNSMHCPEFELVLGTNSSSLGNPENISETLDVLIAHRNVRSCTKHPISKFVSYDNLSPSFHAFTTNLSSVNIPRSVKEAFDVPEWKSSPWRDATHGVWWNYHKARVWSDVNGYLLSNSNQMDWLKDTKHGWLQKVSHKPME